MPRNALILSMLLMASICLLSFTNQKDINVELPDKTIATVSLKYKQTIQILARGLPREYYIRSQNDWINFEELTPTGKKILIKAIFPADSWDKQGITHIVRWPEIESLWMLSVHFTGTGQNYDQIKVIGKSAQEKLENNDKCFIPIELILKELGGKGLRFNRSQPEDEYDDEKKVTYYRNMLRFTSDAQGRYAIYKLRKGEALYSSVVMRYTDSVDPRDVNHLATTIAKRSGIADVTSILPGAEVKIPIEYLAAPFQEEGSIELREENEIRKEVRKISRFNAGPRLKGVKIVLDPGHGGVDPGASANGIWESDYVYDIVMRIRNQLESRTDSFVTSTVKYPGIGFNTRNEIHRPTKIAQILTTPVYYNDGDNPSSVGVSLRWVLANDIYKRHEKSNGDMNKTLFISVHADSLHPTAGGTMIYVPKAAEIPSAYVWKNRGNIDVKEISNGARIKTKETAKMQSEARSRMLSEKLIAELRKSKIRIHENRPIRNIIHRNGKDFVPAVLRYNIAAQKMLIEIGNINNYEDSDLIQDPQYRERYAKAVTDSIINFFSDNR